ncbi:MAG: twin-arginine translocation signal domain-containing protein [Candidatus Aminicenantes bacterium]|nr:twin-arginine translocation signal domain-containing protein [Candidatus Aminicenantes bacterium]
MRRNNNPLEFPVGCPVHRISRRRFLTGCVACAGAAGLTGAPKWLRATGGKSPKIRIIYALHGPKQKVPDWPNVGFDFVPVMERTNAALANRFKDHTFLPVMATGEEQAKKILEADAAEDIDGYIVCQMNCWNRVVQTMVTSDKPVLYADFKYAGSGGFLVYTAGLLREDRSNLGFVASSRIEDLLAAVPCFEEAKAAGASFDFAAATARTRADRTPPPGDLSCRPDKLTVLPVEETIRRMKATKIIAVRGPKADPETTMMGIPVVFIPFSELNDAWAAADKDEARAIADRWIKTASRVIDVSRDELVNSAAMYLAEKKILQKHDAMGITINCLGGFYGDHIHAYPCLGFFELNNQGLVGGCECDVRSAATMTAGTIMTGGRPGYISDPVIDTAKRQIIYAHCVASNRVFGPKGEANPFEILTHSEDRQGASVRSIFPLGYLTTTIEISDPQKEIILHQAKAVANDPDDRACRTKLAAEPVGDIEKLFTMWDKWGWHRVTFYGDLKKPVYELAEALGWKVIEEA